MENVDPDLDDFVIRKEDKKKGRIKAPSSEQDLDKGFVPPNTQKNTGWACNVFLQWKAERNDKEIEKVPDDLIDNPDPEKVNYWLCRFVDEIRMQDGSEYPPRSIHLILAGLQRKMLDVKPDMPKLFVRGSTVFRDLQRACDSTYRKLRSEGIGTEVKHTQIFTGEEEELLWNRGVFGVENPKQLQRAVFFYIGKIFCIRGGEEQRKLSPSQFVRTTEPDCFTYVEQGSKNISGGLAQLRVENKNVPCYSVPEERPRCLVYLLDLYLDKLPLFGFEKQVLYCRPKAHRPADSAWYEAAPVGKNKLSSMVKDMCVEANIPIRTNHSLRATGVTVLFNSHVPEKIIQNTTGHRSLESLRMYEKTSMEQHQAVSNVMISTECTSYNEQMPKRRTVAQSKGKKTEIEVGNSDGGFRCLFGNLTNCSLGNITINVNSGSSKKSRDEEFDEIAKFIDV